jgi:hypothetical protein
VTDDPHASLRDHAQRHAWARDGRHDGVPIPFIPIALYDPAGAP